MAMLIINALLGFREEWNANAAASDLKDALKHEVSVKRDGEMKMLEVELPVKNRKQRFFAEHTHNRALARAAFFCST